MKIFLNILVFDCYEFVYIKYDLKIMIVLIEERIIISKLDEIEMYYIFIDIFLIVFLLVNIYNVGKVKCNIFFIFKFMV